MDLLGLIFVAVFLASLGIGRAIPRLSSAFGRAMLPIVIVLVFTISMWGGNTVKTIQSIGFLLYSSLAYAISTMFLGYALGLFLDGGGGPRSGARRGGPSGLSIIFPLDLVAGWVVGLLVELPRPALLITGELYVLAGVVGLSLGNELGRGVLATGLNGVKAVAYAAIGSVLAGLLLSPLLRVSLKVSLAIALGFGWYTFDGPTVAAYAGPYLGVLAFLANFFREQLTFILVPFLSGSPAALISMGGATTMDDTLPLYASILGRQHSITAMVNGLLLTLLVPVIVPLILSL